MHTRAVLCAVAAVAFTFAVAADGSAQGWKPEKQQVDLVVGSPPGTGQDRVIRLVGEAMQKHSIVPLTPVIVNRAGGGGNIAFTHISQAPDKGHALALSVLSLLTNRIQGISAIGPEDITPVAQLFTEYTAVWVAAGSPLKSAKDLIAELRKNPAAYSICVSPGLGAANHVGLMLPLRALGVDVKKLRIVVFGGSPEAFASLLGGHTDIVAVSASNGIPHVKAGKMRALAITAPARLPDVLADVPVWRELGAEAVVGNWRGLVGAKGMSRAQVAYWEEAIAKVVETPEWKDYLVKASGEPQFMRSAESKKFLDSQYEQIRPVFLELGLAK
jgi:putative tricarboxylic transport membrane protein